VSELWKVAAERSVEFDAAALEYDRYRPRYPDVLFDELTSLVPSRASATEIGAGTGIATIPLVERGLRVLAIEPGHAMAEILMAKRMERVEILSADSRTGCPTGMSSWSSPSMLGIGSTLELPSIASLSFFSPAPSWAWSGQRSSGTGREC
jgi:hypothetical protein